MIALLRGDTPKVVGHRGSPGDFGIPHTREARTPPPDLAAGHGPENTLASFQLALEQAADLIEFDVHLSRDGEVVVIHDERVDRTTDGSGLVADMSLAELKRLDAGSWYSPALAGQRIPTLEEALAWSQGRLPLAIEIKNGLIQYPGIEVKIVELLERHGLLERALCISFDHPTIARLAALRPGLATGLLYACRPIDAPGLAAQCGAKALMPHWSFVAAEDVQAAHAAELAVAPWVTSEPVAWGRLTASGVDAIGTNHPDRLREWLVASTPVPRR